MTDRPAPSAAASGSDAQHAFAGDLAALRAAGDLLAARLASAAGAPTVDEHERACLKAELAALYRQVELRLAPLARLKEDVKGLVACWKALPTTTSAPTPGGDAAPGAVDAPPAAPRASVRVDHLGASTFVTKGWSQLAAGDGAQAEAVLLRALELAPEDAEAGALLGWALLAQGRVDESLDVSHRVLAHRPSYALAQVGVGHARLLQGSFGEAIEHLARAIRDDTDRKATLYATFHLGVVYLEREMYDDALAFFRRALSLGPNLIEAYYQMGRAHWRAGDRAAALEAWRAGGATGKFSAWGARCEQVRAEVERGGAPPALE